MTSSKRVSRKASLADHFVLSEKEQDRFIKLHGTNLAEWRNKVSRIINEHPSIYRILEVGVEDDGDMKLEYEEFSPSFTAMKPALVRLIYDDIDKIDGKVKFTAIHRWINRTKRKEEIKIVKDATFVYNLVKKMQFAQFDDNFNQLISKEEFLKHFHDLGVDDRFTMYIFESIDSNGDGDISIKEFFVWQQRFTKRKFNREAKKYGWNILEDDTPVTPQPEHEAKLPEYVQPEPEVKPEPVVESKPEVVYVEPEPEPEPEVEVEVVYDEPEEKLKPEPEPEPEYVEPEKKPEPEPEPEPEYVEPEKKPVPEPEPEPEVVVVYDEPEQKSEPEIEIENKVQSSVVSSNTTKTSTITTTTITTVTKTTSSKTTAAAIQFDPIPDVIYVKSKTGVWRPSTVEDRRSSNNNNNGGQVSEEWFIHFTGYNVKHNEWILRSSDRISLERPAECAETKVPKKRIDLVGKCVWVESVLSKKWRECVVVERKENRIKIHFISYHKKYDKWIDASLAFKDRPHGSQLLVGDNLSCWSPDFSAWLEVEIVECDVEKNRIQVAFVGTAEVKAEWIDNTSNRLSIAHKKHDDPAPG